MKTIILKQKEILNYLKDKDYTKIAIISFADKNDEGVDFSKYPNLKYIKCFVDDLWYDEVIDETDFNKAFTAIGKFVAECDKEGIEDIICQCVHGESRSAACAAAITEYYNHDGIEIFADYKYSPNQYFYNKIYEAINMNIKK